MTTANRGKVGEALVRKELEKLSEQHANFAFNRIQDARAVNGLGQAQAGDFQAFKLERPLLSRNWLIEVKEIEHDRLLSYGNFKPDQVGRMRVRELAGSIAVVLVYHSQLKLWRYAPLSFFLDRDLSKGSWNMSHIEAKPLPEIMKEIFQ